MPNPAREGTEQDVEVRRLVCKSWECHGEGADMRLEDTEEKLCPPFFCHSFVNALSSAEVTEQVPIINNQT